MCVLLVFWPPQNLMCDLPQISDGTGSPFEALRADGGKLPFYVSAFV